MFENLLMAHMIIQTMQMSDPFTITYIYFAGSLQILSVIRYVTTNESMHCSIRMFS